MKNPGSRQSDSGTITIMAIVLVTTLMGMAGLAIDLGFLYTRSRMMYAVADSAVAVGMKDLLAGASSSITTDISNLAGQYGGAYSITATPAPTATTVSVTVTHTYPFFFGKLLGFPSKTMTVQVAGKKNATPPALLALGNACSGGVGLTITGQGAMTVNGDIQGNGKVNSTTGNGTGICPPTGASAINVSGNMETPCAGGPEAAGSPGHNCWDTVSGTYGTGGPFTDPFAPFTPPTCDYGSLASGADPTVGHWTSTVEAGLGTVWKLDPGVYCTNGYLGITGFFGQGVDCTNVTFIDNGGQIGINLNASSTFTAAPNSPNGVIAYTTNNTSCSAGQAINYGGPSGATTSVTMNGSLYAPQGCINAGANGPTTINGSFIGSELQIGDYASWSIGTGGGGSPSAWQMLQ